MEDYEEDLTCIYCWGAGELEDGTECEHCLGTGELE